jgi:hypothetical protein
LQLTGERAELAQQLMNLVDSQGDASTGDPNIATAFLKYAEAKHFLVSPITAAPAFLPGVELQFTKVKIKTGSKDGEIYQISGSSNYSLHKPAVDTNRRWSRH